MAVWAVAVLARSHCWRIWVPAALLTAHILPLVFFLDEGEDGINGLVLPFVPLITDGVVVALVLLTSMNQCLIS